MPCAKNTESDFRHTPLMRAVGAQDPPPFPNLPRAPGAPGLRMPAVPVSLTSLCMLTILSPLAAGLPPCNAAAANYSRYLNAHFCTQGDASR